MSDAAKPTNAERMEQTKGQYVFLANHCGRVEQSNGPILYIRIDNTSAPGKVEAAHAHFQPLHEQGAEIPAESIWADGASVRITAYRYDPERQLIRMKTERTTRPAP